MLADSGQLEAAHFMVLASAKLATTDPGVAGATVRRAVHGGSCIDSGPSGTVARVAFTDTGWATEQATPLLRIVYAASRSLAINLSLLNGSTTIPAVPLSTPLTFKATTHVLITQVNRWQFTNMLLPLPAGVTFCIASMAVGVPAPNGP